MFVLYRELLLVVEIRDMNGDLDLFKVDNSVWALKSYAHLLIVLIECTFTNCVN